MRVERPAALQLVPLLVATIMSVAAAFQTAQVAPPRPGGNVKAPAPLGAIVGQVVDAGSGQPVEGARVMLSGSATQSSQTMYSDDDGRFAFAGLPADKMTLRASKTGYVSVIYGQRVPHPGRPGTPIALLAGQVVKDLVFPIPRGGVITGAVFDEKGRPSVGTPVLLMRWSIATGERALTSAGSATTDDRGMYRVYGLPPGEYVVSAMPRNLTAPLSEVSLDLLAAQERLRELAAANTFPVGPPGSGGEVVIIPRDPEAASLRREAPAVVDGYAPVYFPGTTALNQAGAVTLGVSEERSGVDFALSRTVLVRVRGTVAVPADLGISSVQLRLVDLSARVPGVSTPSARTGRDGTFTFPAVPPGPYRLSAVATYRTRVPAAGNIGATGTTNVTSRLWAMTDVAVSGVPIDHLTLALQPAFSLSGRIVYDGQAIPPKPGTRVRVSLGADGSFGSALGASTVTANVGADGRFTIDGLVPAPYRFRSVSGASGWSPRSAVAGGRDLLDVPLELEPQSPVPEITVTLTDRRTELAGRLYDLRGQPTADFTVVVFPDDRQYWVPQSRRIRSARPTTAGEFSFSGLPAGTYRLAALTDVEPGLWYDPALLKQLVGGSVMISLVEGQRQTQDIRVNAGG